MDGLGGSGALGRKERDVIYAVSHSTLDLWLAAFFGVAGYKLKTWGFVPTPLLLGFVLGRPLEENLTRALVFADGDMTTFLRHPVSAVLLAIAAVAIVLSVVPGIRRAAARIT